MSRHALRVAFKFQLVPSMLVVKEDPAMELLAVIGALLLLDVLALRFGTDSRDFTRRWVWW
jgi:hypothetical protein